MLNVNSVGLGQPPGSVIFDVGQHCLPTCRYHVWYAGHKWEQKTC